MKQIATWRSSNSPYADTVIVRAPEDCLPMPCPGAWKKAQIGRETVYVFSPFSPHQSRSDWMAWFVRGEIVQFSPAGSLKIAAHHKGNQSDLTLLYVRPQTAILFAGDYKCRTLFQVFVVGPGETRQAYADDFVEPEVLLP